MAVSLSNDTASQFMQGLIDLMVAELTAAKDSEDDHSETLLNYASAIQAVKEASQPEGE